MQVAPNDPVPVVVGVIAGVVVAAVNCDGKVTVIVEPEVSDPDEDVLKFTVHVDAVFAVVGDPAKPTAETAVDALATSTPTSGIVAATRIAMGTNVRINLVPRP